LPYLILYFQLKQDRYQPGLVAQCCTDYYLINATLLRKGHK